VDNGLYFDLEYQIEDEVWRVTMDLSEARWWVSYFTHPDAIGAGVHITAEQAREIIKQAHPPRHLFTDT